MQRYFLIYVIFIVIFHICNYFIWKTAQGKRQVAAYLRFGKTHFFLFLFLCILPYKSVSVLFKAFGASCLILGYIMEFMIWRCFMKSCLKFRQNLRPDSKIIILEMHSMRAPWKLWRKFADLIIITGSALFINIPPVIQRDEYLIAREVIAYAFRRDMEACSSYLYCFPSKHYPFSGKKSIFWKEDIELYLIGRKENGAVRQEDMPFPGNRIRFLNSKDAVVSFPLGLIKVIEDGGIYEAAEEKLAVYIGYQGEDPGKACLAQLIRLLLEKRRSVTEYFYELMKLAEFMIHYQSLADYEIAGSRYFDDEKPVAMGTFQSGIADTGLFEPKEKEVYINAVKYLNRVCRGKEGSIDRKNLLAEGRRKLVMVRNHFIGHGSLSYGISADFVRNLLIVISEQTDGFFCRTEPVVRHFDINGVPKFHRQEDRLYLLIKIEKNIAGYYLDHASGKYFTNVLREEHS